MEVSEQISNSSESFLGLEGDDDLPMKVVGVVSVFQLALDVLNAWREVWCEMGMRDGENPVAGLCVLARHAGSVE